MKQIKRTFVMFVVAVFLLSSYSIPIAMAQEAPQMLETSTVQEPYMA